MFALLTSGGAHKRLAPGHQGNETVERAPISAKEMAWPHLLRRYRYVRSPDGETHVWLARSRRTGRGEASSGLEFDALHPRAAV